MEPLSLLAVLNLLGAAQGLLLALALLSVRRGNRTANRILAAFAAALSICVAGSVVRTTHFDIVFPHLSRVHDPFPFLAIPLLFLYVKTLTARKSGLEKKDCWHFVPFGLCVLYLVPYFVRSSQYKLNYLISEAYYPSLGPWYYIRSALLILLALVYLIFTIKAVVAYSRRVQNQNSPVEKSVLLQLRVLGIGFLLIFVGGVLRYTLDHTAKTNLVIPFGISILVYTLAFLALRMPEALTGGEETPAAKRYEKSTLTPERSEVYLKKLLHFMEANKPYTNGDLTLQKLAKELSISPHHLSQMINERLNRNFFDFVNVYRIEEAKRMLVDPGKKHYSIIAIAEEVGFNSKSAFNMAFKKYTNTTPSEFRRVSNGNGAPANLPIRQ